MQWKENYCGYHVSGKGAAFMTGCSGAGNTTAQKAGNGKSVVTVWAGGSDNVRVQFEKQIETFNASRQV